MIKQQKIPKNRAKNIAIIKIEATILQRAANSYWQITLCFKIIYGSCGLMSWKSNDDTFCTFAAFWIWNEILNMLLFMCDILINHNNSWTKASWAENPGSNLLSCIIYEFKIWGSDPIAINTITTIIIICSSFNVPFPACFDRHLVLKTLMAICNSLSITIGIIKTSFLPISFSKHHIIMVWGKPEYYTQLLLHLCRGHRKQ